MSPRLELRDAAVRRGGQVVLEGVSFSVEAGELVGIIGPNGAGKTTLVRAALGLQALSAGHARLDGDDVGRLSPASTLRLTPSRTVWRPRRTATSSNSSRAVMPASSARRARRSRRRWGLRTGR